MRINILSFLVLAPLFFFPFRLCPFKLPYLYCFICPVRCLWYRIRGLVILLVLGLNMKSGFFCNRLCPYGFAQILLSKMSKRKVILPKSLAILKYAVLALVIALIAATRTPEIQNFKIAGLALGHILITKSGNILLAAVILSTVLSMFSYRFFCRNLCPITALNTFLRIKTKEA